MLGNADTNKPVGNITTPFDKLVLWQKGDLIRGSLNILVVT
jgi:hypothetical protein